MRNALCANRHRVITLNVNSLIMSRYNLPNYSQQVVINTGNTLYQRQNNLFHQSVRYNALKGVARKNMIIFNLPYSLCYQIYAAHNGLRMESSTNVFT